MIQTTVDETSNDTSEVLKMCLDHFDSDFDELEYISELNEFLDSNPSSSESNQGMLTNVDTQEHPKLDLKPLPQDLKYA